MSIIYGSPLFLSSSSQNADLPPLLDNFKAYIGTTPPEPETITLADIPVSDAETETIVNLKENDGQLHPYIYLSNNYENSKAGLLLRKDIYQIGTIDNTSGNKYQNNSLDNWCVTTFVSYLDTIVKDLLVEVDIPSTSGTKIRRNCFALSVSEYGGNQLSEGNAIPYFNSNSKRVSMYESNSRDYWTRSSYADVGSTAYFIKSTGEISSNISAQKGYRPAICLNLSLTLKTVPNEDGSYDMYEGQAVQTLSETDGVITIAADKMEESRAKELAGAVWVYSDHIPKNVNDGTKIQLTREEITRPDGEIYITLSDIPASDADIETVVNIKESDGQLHPYLYLSNDYEGSGAALLLRKDVYQKGQFYSAVRPYNGCSLDNWCENTFLTSVLDSFVQTQLVSVNIQIQGSYISRRCFALSIVEYGWGASASEGTALPYFKDDKTRISLYQGSSVDYYTRTYQAGNIWFIGLMGNAGTESGTLSLGYRPAICIKKSFKIKSIPNEDGSYDMYDEVSSISTFASSEFTVEKQVSWEKTKDFHARQFTFNSKKQYQTMLEGAVASPNKVPEGQPITNLKLKDKIKIGKYNNNVLKWTISDTNSDFTICLDADSVTQIGMKQFDSNNSNRYVITSSHAWINAKDSMESGFLSQWSEYEINALKNETWIAKKSSTIGGGTETFEARVVIPSATEVGIASGDGTTLELFNDSSNRVIGVNWWTRTPQTPGNLGSYIDKSGSLYFLAASSNAYIRPLCKILTEGVYVSNEPDSDGYYTITGVMK